MSPKPPQWMRVTIGLALAVGALPLLAQSSIYSCVDRTGKRITSDRPIAECMDREQKEHRGDGSIKRIVPPHLTAEEKQAQAERDKAQAERLARLEEDKRRDRALLVRYPNRTVHDKARADALKQVDEMDHVVKLQQAETEKQRKAIADEMEFYQKDPSKAPAILKKKVEDNARQVQSLQNKLTEHEAERRRINERFDQELQKLQSLWAS